MKACGGAEAVGAVRVSLGVPTVARDVERVVALLNDYYG
jgi:cysteine sulfinate desulfinase/cysteine desulfurase-like protein